MTAPNGPVPDDEPRDADSSRSEAAPGAEIGMSEKAGSTFEPEEDPEAGD